MPSAKPRSTRRRRERSPEQIAAAADARAERLEGLHQQLAHGVAAIRDGDSWADWLAAAAKFHRYSFGNQILIAMQKPDASLVAGYGAWQAMGRQVIKGEKALWILAPVTRRGPRPDPDGALDADDVTEPTTTGADVGDPTGPASRARVVGFTGAAVFDVSQTEGDPVPTPPRPQLLAGQAPPGLWDALTEAITARGFTVTRCPDTAAIGGANGVTDYTTRTVTVRADVDDAMAVKTLAHDLLTAPTPGFGVVLGLLCRWDAPVVCRLAVSPGGLCSAPSDGLAEGGDEHG